ncbi:YitT family protein [Paenibacillus hamazuiensis]|uniref:YitT family protein n=1 Tax=Paenibacillus hamazuiensis TaxID=2936508 RepID=UPI00200F4DA3|nr:YitT family protein [Paenibacillus hamazuiensis]
MLGGLLIIAAGSLFVAAGFNLFLVPHQLLSGGISGISMIIGYLTGWNIGFLLLLSNVPIMIWGLWAIGRKFVVLSTVSVILTSWFLQFIPAFRFIQDPILTAVAGGVMIGIGTGISMRAGGSTGGFDVVGSILTRDRDFPLGTLLFGLNGLVILALGYFKRDWDLALGSMLSIYMTGKVIDTIHTRHLKVTVFIITKQKQLLLDRLLLIQRGVTAIQSEGAYTQQQQDMLMTVTTRYELAELKSIVRRTDPHAFVNIVETVGVMGRFRRDKTK